MVSHSEFTANRDGRLDIQRDLGIGDDGGKKDGMCAITAFAEHPGNTQGDGPVRKLNLPGIAAIPDQIPGMATGTGKEGQV